MRDQGPFGWACELLLLLHFEFVTEFFFHLFSLTAAYHFKGGFCTL
uniref:Uncharacterized protein n=1 Tax=Anguilla anguilla TaxID=7936 RepID=A0A0E9TCJ6_ANGAN